MKTDRPRIYLSFRLKPRERAPGTVAPPRRLFTVKRGRAGVLVGLDGCEVRLVIRQPVSARVSRVCPVLVCALVCPLRVSRLPRSPRGVFLHILQTPDDCKKTPGGAGTTFYM